MHPCIEKGSFHLLATPSLGCAQLLNRDSCAARPAVLWFLMADIHNIEDHLPHMFFEAMCILCYHRWIVVIPETTLLKDIECLDGCGPGYVINTGQIVNG